MERELDWRWFLAFQCWKDNAAIDLKETWVAKKFIVFENNIIIALLSLTVSQSWGLLSSAGQLSLRAPCMATVIQWLWG